jgi:hypothetical protein
MNAHGTYVVPCLLSALLVLTVLAPDADAVDRRPEGAIEAFLSSQESDQETADSQGSAVADLNGDGRPEIVLVWTSLGPTYWQNYLTVLSQTGNGYKPVASIALEGEAKLSSVKYGIIRVGQTVYAKGDPKCCPSIKKQAKYRWIGRKIVEMKE